MTLYRTVPFVNIISLEVNPLLVTDRGEAIKYLLL